MTADTRVFDPTASKLGQVGACGYDHGVGSDTSVAAFLAATGVSPVVRMIPSASAARPQRPARRRGHGTRSSTESIVAAAASRSATTASGRLTTPCARIAGDEQRIEIRLAKVVELIFGGATLLVRDPAALVRTPTSMRITSRQ